MELDFTAYCLGVFATNVAWCVVLWWRWESLTGESGDE